METVRRIFGAAQLLYNQPTLLSDVIIYYVSVCEVVIFLNIIVGANISESIKEALVKNGFTVCFTVENPRVLHGLRYHPDMQLSGCYGHYVCERGLYDYYKKILCPHGVNLTCGESLLTCNYPGDIAYNVKVVGDSVFHKKGCTDSVLKQVLKDKEFIDVSQGYSGCSICKVSENAIITADMSIHKKAMQNSICSLLISPDHIDLEGFDYGFIGGASFYADKTVYFFGDVSKHPDFKAMEEFCKFAGSRIVTLGIEKLTDYGSAITF